MNGIPLSIKGVLDLIERGCVEKTFTVRDVECLVVFDESGQYVIPRGTEIDKFFSAGGWRDVLRDFMAVPMPSRRLRGWSHAGYLSGARRLVDCRLDWYLAKEWPVWLFGHSMGGAIALNIAALLHAEGFIVGGVVTVGAPRTFTRRTANRVVELGFPVFEYTNPGDPVPDLPLRWWGYRHCNEIKTDRPCGCYLISKNHHLTHYREALEN